MNKTTSKRTERGQSLVEFSLSAILLVVLFSGLVDLARVYFTYIALEDAAGEAALYLSLNPSCAVPGPGCENPNNARWRAKNAVQGQLGDLVDWDAPTTRIRPRLDSAATVGGTVFVTIEYQHTLITPILRYIGGSGGTIPLEVQARQTIVSE